MANIFNISYNRLATMLMPTFMRGNFILSLIRAMIAPIMLLHEKFMYRRSDMLYSLGITGQVCSLRRMLNETFPEAGGLIRIEGSEQIAHSLRVPDKDVESGSTYLKVSDDISLQLWDADMVYAGVNKFFVYLPTSIYTQDNISRARALLNQYKLTSKNPEILQDNE